MDYKVISESKDGKRIQVCFYHKGQSYTRHLRLEGNRWRGIAIPGVHKRGTTHTVTNPKVVYSLASYKYQRGRDGSITTICKVPIADYTEWHHKAILEAAA